MPILLTKKRSLELADLWTKRSKSRLLHIGVLHFYLPRFINWLDSYGIHFYTEYHVLASEDLKYALYLIRNKRAKTKRKFKDPEDPHS